MSSWIRGADEIEALVNGGELELISPSHIYAERLLGEARANIDSATTILEANPAGALQLAYTAARKAATSLLAAQGLRPTARGGHVAVADATRAQFDGPFLQFGRMRRRRANEEYPQPDSPAATAADGEDMIEYATKVTDAATILLATDQLSPWHT
ncbi:MAG TPA: hypothetical protein ENH33_03095 [Actinobacteria bacterium]|nr:hypothetical protein [Actinomycetota bacterium]